MAEPQVDMKLEVAMLGVSDVDRAKAFYENLGWRLDADVASDGFHAVQVTPHDSEASIIFGKGVTSPRPGSAGETATAFTNTFASPELASSQSSPRLVERNTPSWVPTNKCVPFSMKAPTCRSASAPPTTGRLRWWR